jgi:hypothetical protein
MKLYDLINAGFSIGGSIFLWLNVLSLYKEREVKGVHWGSVAYFSILGFWNLFFYSHLTQWYSVVAGTSGVLANIVWLGMALWIRLSKLDRFKLGL